MVKRTGRDGAITYLVRARLKGSTATATFKRKTDAQRWAQSTEAAIRYRRYFKTAEAERRTLADAIERYERTHLAVLKSAEDRGRHLVWW